MISGSKSRLIRRFVTVFSALFVSLFAAGRLSQFALAENTPQGPQVLGLNNEDTIIEVIPPRSKTVSVFKPKTVEIKHKGIIYRGITYSNTVEDAVKDFGIEITSATQMHPDADFQLGEFTSILIDEIVRKDLVEYESIAYGTEEIEDNNIEWGIKNIVKQGTPGQKKMIYEYLYINGSFMGKTLISETIVTSPVSEVVSLGTKKVFKTAVIDGVEITYWRVIEGMRATSYDRFCYGCTSYTYTGKLLEKGMVAVDPTVIPLGTHLYVPGYGDACAEDIGGAVKGNRIDLGFDKISNWFGKVSYGMYVDVYVLD